MGIFNDVGAVVAGLTTGPGDTSTDNPLVEAAIAVGIVLIGYGTMKFFSQSKFHIKNLEINGLKSPVTKK